MSTPTIDTDDARDECPDVAVRRPARPVYFCPQCGGQLRVVLGQVACIDCPTEFAPVACSQNTERRN